MIRIGVVSDTHIPVRAKTLPKELFTGLEGVDVILHAGDVAQQDVLLDLGDLAPVYAVCGNIDPPELCRKLPKAKRFDFEGFEIGLVHGDGPGRSTVDRALQAFPDADCTVFGHSHQPYNQRHGKTLLFNPGSPTDRRRQPQFSYGLLFVDGSGIRAEHRFFGP